MSNSEDWIQRAERRMPKYIDLVAIEARDNGESMVELTPQRNLLIDQRYLQMRAVTGNKIFVRESVQYMLGSACLNLALMDQSLQLQVVYGYRSLDVQKQNYEEQKLKLEDQYSGLELIEATHRRIAEPSVAGHPTGGAVDIQLTRNGKPLTFGTQIRDFVPETYVECPSEVLGEAAFKNRQLLRRTMLAVGFAPYDGEWWHFSYGDREWANYYNKPRTEYEQVEFKSV